MGFRNSCISWLACIKHHTSSEYIMHVCICHDLAYQQMTTESTPWHKVRVPRVIPSRTTNSLWSAAALQASAPACNPRSKVLALVTGAGQCARAW